MAAFESADGLQDLRTEIEQLTKHVESHTCDTASRAVQRPVRPRERCCRRR